MVFSKDFLDSVVLSGWGLERGGHLGGNSVWRTRQLAQNKKKQKLPWHLHPKFTTCLLPIPWSAQRSLLIQDSIKLDQLSHSERILTRSFFSKIPKSIFHSLLILLMYWKRKLADLFKLRTPGLESTWYFPITSWAPGLPNFWTFCSQDPSLDLLVL